MERQHIFAQLKQPCIQLLQITATLAQRPNGRKDLVDALSKLLNALQAVSSKPDAVDSRLAEYVFVPISQVLRISRTVPVRALELCLECISILLRTGWGGSLAPELSGQLLILFTFMAKPSSNENGVAGSSEELQTLALKCITELFAQSSKSTQGKQQLTATANIPALGESILVILDCLADSNSNTIRLQAVAATSKLVSAIDDLDALASFLPRIVSSLTKVLTPSSSNRTAFRVLERCLDVMSLLFLRLLGEQATKDLPKLSPESSRDGSKTVRSVSWLQATASQIKVALGNVLKLRNHDKSEVRQALLRLCTTIVQECRNSLADCSGMVVETMVILAGRGDANNANESDLRIMLSTDAKLADLLKESLHGWIISLPRLMQSKDDAGRRQVIHQISTTLRLFDEDQILVNDLLADNLRDGVSAVFNDSKTAESIVEAAPPILFDQQLIPGTTTSASFAPLQFRLKGQDDTVKEFRVLLRELAQSNSAITITQDLVNGLDVGTQESRLATFWVSVNLLRDTMRLKPCFDDFLDLGGSNPQEELLDDLYSHALTVLSPHDTSPSPNWHAPALALEVFAMQAARYKTEFRAELTETLYPVLHCLGSSNPGLRNHAITCLNIIAESCGYGSASELVISNVDYIVNAVGLRLSYGDVSPQAPQVLLMMMRLCGPSLLPYLDDLVGSIFGALERYHGYPSLVELLFSVLKGMAEEGAKTPQLAITSSAPHAPEDSPTPDILTQLKALEHRTREQARDLSSLPRGAFPQQPWKDLDPETLKDPSAPEDDSPGDHESPKPEPEDPAPPAPLTYSLLLKISELTQHYLTSSSAPLRTSLLSLLQTTIPALSRHENSFLPLINTLWPILLPRLEDTEAYIVASALDVVGLLCEYAGGFMRSRIDNAFPVFKKLHRRTGGKMGGASGTGKMRSMKREDLGKIAGKKTDLAPSSNEMNTVIYIDTPARMIWDALVRLLCSISAHIPISGEAFEDVLDMLEPVITNPQVKVALDKRNADAVWLRVYKRRKAAGELPDGKAEMGGPVGPPEWGFVTL
ncbi:ARM repeat-containing protein [Paraphaeosphaeria sporulosa]|uniref:ARM repeat-containing protein n=1 Tax=Paraphaeosphaeria sporulosa TaxID=1460663 RepID=A0A177BVE5_9PLEO|nr:ARM repeat-containing protein [Paraphaeosphaeria sporulosa]OAF99284.1 ARM repeat-containing protein [Paraphaeosphaeria sporulosa]